MRHDVQEVPRRSERHGDLPKRRMLCAVQRWISQLQREVREQQRPGDLWKCRMFDGLQDAVRRRQRDLQRHGMRSNLSEQRASALRGRLHRTDRSVRRQVSGGRTKILCGQRHMYLDGFLLHIQRLRRHQAAVLLGRAVRGMHDALAMWHQQDLQQQ
jgi:hypothetical protein